MKACVLYKYRSHGGFQNMYQHVHVLLRELHVVVIRQKIIQRNHDGLNLLNSSNTVLFCLHIGCRVCPMQFYMAYSLTGLCQDFIVYTLWGLLSHYLVIPLRQLVAPQVTTTLSPSLLPNLSTCSLSHNYTLLHYSVHHFYIWNNVIPS